MRYISGILVFLSICSYGQEKETRVYEEFRVSLHQLHVNVTDKDGNPVKDLGAEDFRVKLNGKDQEVISVLPISLEQAVEAGEVVPEQGKRMFVFVFDMQNNVPAGIIKARTEAMKFVVNDMLESDLGALFTLAGSNIRMVCNFTPDRGQLLKALETFGFDEDAGYWSQTSGFVATGKNLKDGQGISAREAFHSLSKKVIESSEILSLTDASGKWDDAAAYINHGMEDPRNESKKGSMSGFLDLFKVFADYLKVIGGTKNMILFSSGFKDGGLAVGASRSMGDDAFGSGEIISTARRLVEVMEGSGIKVFTIDTSRTIGTAWQNTSMHVLNDLSSSTGGRIFTNSDDYGSALRQIKSISNDYYLVQIQSNLNLKAGELANVKVIVNRPKTKVYASKGLLLTPDYKVLGDMERRLMLTNFVARDMLANSIPANLDIARVRHKDNAHRINLNVGIEGSYFLLSKEPQKPISIEIMTAIIDTRENLMIDQDHSILNFVPESARPVLEKTGLKYFTDLFANAGQYKVKLIIRNLENGHTTSIIRDLTIPEEPMMLADPVAVTNRPWIVINSEDLPTLTGAPKENQNGYLYGFENAKLLPMATADIKPGDPLQVLYLLEPEILSDPKDFALEVNVFDASGKKLNADASALKMTALRGGLEGRIGLLVSLDGTAFGLSSGNAYLVQARVTTNKTGVINCDYKLAL